MSRRLLALLALVLLALDARADSCVDGTNCFCDCVVDPSQDAVECLAKYGISSPISGVLMCEDFEAITLYDARGTGADGKTGQGAGSSDDCVEGNLTANCYGNSSPPLYGPWYDTSGGSSTYRGGNSYWTRKYDQSAGCGFSSLDPTPVLGNACGSNCGCKEWSAGDPWTAVGGPNEPIIDIMRDGEFDDELAGNPAPTIPSGGSGVFDGLQVLANRIGIGAPKVSGFHGYENWTGVTHIGIIYAMAFSPNIVSEGPMNRGGSPWKFNEFTSGNRNGGLQHDGWPLGNVGVVSASRPASYLPFTGYFAMGGSSQATHAAANSTLVVGRERYAWGSGLYYSPAAPYSQATDWPWGTWGCVSGEYEDDGSVVSVKIKFNDTTLLHVTGIPHADIQYNNFDALTFNTYFNGNENVGSGNTTNLSYRYDDNLLVVSGAPPACSAIGFSTTPPSWGPGGPGDGTKREQPKLDKLARLAAAERKLRKRLTLSLGERP